MENTMIYLIGFPGTGKYTIAKEICAQEDVKLVDNHLINNPVFSLIERDGKTPLPQTVWDSVDKVRRVVFETMAYISPAHFNFVLTNVLFETPEDHRLYDNVQKLAVHRGAEFVPVFLEIEMEENMRRIASPERKLHMKQLHPETARSSREENALIQIAHPNRLDLDVTAIQPDEAAHLILEHARSC